MGAIGAGSLSSWDATHCSVIRSPSGANSIVPPRGTRGPPAAWIELAVSGSSEHTVFAVALVAAANL